MRYQLIYLPVAKSDLESIINYIAETLKAPMVAMDFLDDLERSVTRLSDFPFSCRVYHPVQELSEEYRVLRVKKYLVFYLVKEELVEIHRILYARMDLGKLL